MIERTLNMPYNVENDQKYFKNFKVRLIFNIMHESINDFYLMAILALNV